MCFLFACKSCVVVLIVSVSDDLKILVLEERQKSIISIENRTIITTNSAVFNNPIKLILQTQFQNHLHNWAILRNGQHITFHMRAQKLRFFVFFIFFLLITRP